MKRICLFCEKEYEITWKKQKYCSYSCGRKATPRNPMATREARAKVSRALKGRPSKLAGRSYEEIHGPQKGKELKERRRKHALEYPFGKSRFGSANPMWGHRASPEARAIMSEMRRGRSYIEIYGEEKASQLKKQRREKLIGHPVSKETRKKISRALKRAWSNPSHVKKMCKLRGMRPNKAEIRLATMMEEAGFPFQYVGDGRLVIGGKLPDFVDPDNKYLIELFGERWHKTEEEKERREYFATFGYKTLVIWYKELKNETAVISKIKEFIRIQPTG